MYSHTHQTIPVCSSTTLSIRYAIESDVSLILGFIRELAAYEKLSHKVTATDELLKLHLFGPEPKASVLLAFHEDSPIGFALFFRNFSTFLAKPGVYLEDLYVKEEWRGRGYGRALLVALARIAVQEGCGRFEWSVLDWNTPSINFYKSLGAEPMDEWTVFRVTGERLEKLASMDL